MNLQGRTVTLKTKRGNGIQPIVEIKSDDGKWIRWESIFGGKPKRSLRTRIDRVLSAQEATQ